MHQPFESAKLAKLKYVNEEELCYFRRRCGKGFIYLDEKGDKITDKEILDRIRLLVIPPAWRNVKICPTDNGHIQAVGRDAKGRKQYIYHAKWEEVRNKNKFGKIVSFGEALPELRRKIDEDLRRPGLPKNRVMAVIVRLLEDTLIRIGNSEYAKTNNSYGLTTLKDKHIQVEGANIRFAFRGKSGKDLELDLKDRRLARLVKKCQEIPGQQLFQYYDEEGKRQPVESSDVNQYLKEITGEDFTAKDFRTWGGTVLAAVVLNRMEAGGSEREKNKNITKAVKLAASGLNNTPAICRKYYIHPEVINSYITGELFNIMKKADKLSQKSLSVSQFNHSKEETAVLIILKQNSGSKPAKKAS